MGEAVRRSLCLRDAAAYRLRLELLRLRARQVQRDVELPLVDRRRAQPVLELLQLGLLLSELVLRRDLGGVAGTGAVRAVEPTWGSERAERGHAQTGVTRGAAGGPGESGAAPGIAGRIAGGAAYALRGVGVRRPLPPRLLGGAVVVVKLARRLVVRLDPVLRQRRRRARGALRLLAEALELGLELLHPRLHVTM